MVRAAALAIPVVTALIAVSCASRPSETELAAAIMAATADRPGIAMTPERAGCLARGLLASNLSDTTLSGLADDFSQPEVLETETDDLEPLIAEIDAGCSDGAG